MADENLAGAVDAEASVLLDENGEPTAAIVNMPEGEEETGGTESEAIALATIEAEKEIAVAAIHAGVEEARIEAESERVISWHEHEAEMETLRTNIQELNRAAEEMQARLSQAEASLLTPTPQPEPEALAEEIALEPSLMQPSIAESENPMENGPSEEEENRVEIAAVLAVPARKRRRLI